VVICSDHGDHTNGNAAFKAAYPDVVFISSPASQKVMANKPNPPTETVPDKRIVSLGQTDIQILNLGRAHTGGDLTVFVPGANVLFLGEIYFHRLFPAMRTAYPKEWLATIQKAQAMNAAWYIPGHGFVDDQKTLKAELEEYRKALAYVVSEATRLHDAHVPCISATDCEAAVRADWGKYGAWSLRAGQEALGTFRVYQELDGQLP
jgi:glyoxylase-like metal-dependent hydrolase (beta-lactamase superfamily II)